LKVQIAKRSDALRVPNAALRFRPTSDMFAALNQAVPPEAQFAGGGRGNRSGGRGQGGQGGQGSQGGAPSATAGQGFSLGSGRGPGGQGFGARSGAAQSGSPQPGNAQPG